MPTISDKRNNHPDFLCNYYWYYACGEPFMCDICLLPHLRQTHSTAAFTVGARTDIRIAEGSSRKIFQNWRVLTDCNITNVHRTTDNAATVPEGTGAKDCSLRKHSFSFISCFEMLKSYLCKKNTTCLQAYTI